MRLHYPSNATHAMSPPRAAGPCRAKRRELSLSTFRYSFLSRSPKLAASPAGVYLICLTRSSRK
jgi:hypothetical protein